MEGFPDKPIDPIDASVFVICQNEARSIGKCLASVSRFTDIVVVDSGSTDDTLKIVEELSRNGLPISVFERSWRGYAEQKQFALQSCSRDWCLNLDADETIDEEAVAAIERIVSSRGPNAAFELTRREWLPGYGYVHPWASQDRIVRLVDRRRASYDTAQRVHESLSVDGHCGRISRGNIWHKPDLTIEQIVAKHNIYSTLKSEMLLERGRAGQPWRLVTSPIGYFLKYYFLKRYILCGWAGYAISAMYAHYAFQTAWKTWFSNVAASAGERDQSKTGPAD